MLKGDVNKLISHAEYLIGGHFLARVLCIAGTGVLACVIVSLALWRGISLAFCEQMLAPSIMGAALGVGAARMIQLFGWEAGTGPIAVTCLALFGAAILSGVLIGVSFGPPGPPGSDQDIQAAFGGTLGAIHAVTGAILGGAMWPLVREWFGFVAR